VQSANDRAGKAIRSSFQVLVGLGGEDADFVPPRGEAVHDIANANFIAAVGIGWIKRGNGQDFNLSHPVKNGNLGFVSRVDSIFLTLLSGQNAKIT
jgi:hypothetical protein